MRLTLIQLLSCIILLFTCSVAHSGHLLGAYIEHECLGPAPNGNPTYEVTLSVFYDCFDDGIDYLSDQGIRWRDASNNFANVNLSYLDIAEVSQLCQADLDQSNCGSGNLPGVFRARYRGTFEYDDNDGSDFLRLTWKENYRGITANIDNSSNIQFHVYSEIYLRENCNSSPLLTVQQIPYVCVGNNNVLNFGFNDLEGDSLSFNLVDATLPGPFDLPTTLPYEAGFSGPSPVPGASIDPVTGQLELNAPFQGNFTIAIEVSEYNASGDLVSTQVFDFVILALNCPNPPPFPLQEGFINPTGSATIISNSELELCTGEEFCVDMQFGSSVTDAEMTAFSNISSILPGGTIEINGTNPITVTICWDGSGMTEGGNVVVTASDELCSIPGTYSASFDVTVKQGVFADAVVNYCPGQSVSFSAGGSDNYTWTSISGDPVSFLSCDDCDNPSLTPSQNSVFEVTGTSSTAGCSSTDQVQVLETLDFDAALTGTGCSGEDGAISIEFLTGSGDFAINFDGTQSNLNGSYTFDTLGLGVGNYTIELIDLTDVCTKTINLPVNSSVFIPSPEITLAENPCGLDISFDASTDDGGLLWTASGPGTVTFSDNTTEDPTASVSVDGEYTFYLTETDPLSTCSAVDSITLTLSNLSPIVAGVDTVICDLTYTMPGQGDGGTWAWFDLSGTASLSPDASTPNATLTVPSYGEYTFLWTLDRPGDCDSAGQVVIEFAAPPMAEVPDTLTFCQLNDNSLSANSAGPGQTGTWSIPTGNFSFNPILPNTTIQNNGSFGEFEAIWTLDNGGCSDSDTVLLRYVEPEDAQIVGFDVQVCGPEVDMEATNSAGTWSSTTTDITFTNQSSPNTTVSAAQEGTYTIAWTVGEGVCATQDSRIVVFTDSAEVSISLDDAIVCSTGAVGVTGTVSGAASFSWNSSGNGTFSPVDNLNSGYSPDPLADEGTIIIALNAEGEGVCPDVQATSSLQVVAAPSVEADASSSTTICSDASVILDGTALNTSSVLWSSSGDGAFLSSAMMEDPQYFPGPGDVASGSAMVYISGPATNAVCALAIDSLALSFIEAADAGRDSLYEQCITGGPLDLNALLSPNADSGGSWTDEDGSGALTGSQFNAMSAGLGSWTFHYTVLGINPCGDDEAVININVTEGANAGLDSVALLCENDGIINLNDFLGPDADTGGDWTDDDGTGALSGNTVDVGIAGPGVFAFTYRATADGCADDTAVISLDISSPPSATIFDFPSGSCGLSEIALEATAIADSIEWTSNGTGSFNPDDALATSYSPSQNDLDIGSLVLTVTAYGSASCSIEEHSITLSLEGPPNAGSNNSAILCTSSSSLDLNSLLSAEAESGGSWEDLDLSGGLSGTTLNPSMVTEGDYTFGYTVSGGAQCPDSVSLFELTISTAADAGNDSTIRVCEGDEILTLFNLLGGQPQSGGFWTILDSPLGWDGINLDISALDPGTYGYEYTVNIPACSSQDESILTVIIDPSMESEILTEADTTCFGNAINLEASFAGGSSLDWMSSGTGAFSNPNGSATQYTPSPDDLNAGSVTFYFEVDEALSVCPSAIDSIAYTIQAPASVSELADTTLCAGASLSLNITASNTNAILWSSTGDGSFNEPNSVNSIYTPGINDLSNGTIDLSITASGIANCPAVTESLSLTLQPGPNAGSDASPAFCILSEPVDLELLIGPDADTGGTWTDVDSSSGLSGSVLSPSSVSPGSYLFEYVVSGSGVCEADTSEVNVTITNGPDAGLDSESDICESAPAITLFDLLDGSPNPGGAWSEASVSGGLDGDAFDPSAAGTGSYTLEYIVSLNDCGNDTSLLELTVTPSASIQILGPIDPLCSNDTVALALDGSLISTPTWSSSGDGTFSSTTAASPSYIPGASDIGSGEVAIYLEADGLGSCSSVQDTLTITLLTTPEVSAGPDMSSCGLSTALDGETSVGTLEWTGPAGSVFSNFTNPNSAVSAPDYGVYVFELQATNGTCIALDSVSVTFLDSPDTISTSTICINTNTAYILSFDINGGDSDTYSVSGAGTLTGNTFNSDPIATGGAYNFTLDDANGCQPLTISGSFNCPTLSFAGTLSIDTIRACENQLASADYANDPFLDENDVLVFYLHDDPLNIGNLLSSSSTQDINPPPGITLETVYYITAFVGDDNGDGEPDIDNPNTVRSATAPVIWHATPAVELISAEETICTGDSAELELSFSGNAPFSWNWSDGLNSSDFLSDASSFTFFESQAGAFQISVLQDQYCSSNQTLDAEIQVLELPTASSDAEWRTCSHAIEPVSVALTGIGPWTYSVDKDGGFYGEFESSVNTGAFLPDGTGVFVITSISDALCQNGEQSSTDVEVVASPDLSSLTDFSLCPTDTVTLAQENIPVFDYSWQSDGLIVSNPDSSTTTVSALNSSSEPVSGNISLSASFDICTVTESAAYTIFPLPTDIGVMGDTSLCEGASIQVQAFGGESYEWAPQEGLQGILSATPTLSPSTDTTYTVSVTNTFGCSNQALHAVTVLPTPSGEMEAVISEPCPPAQVTYLNLSDPNEYDVCNWTVLDGTIVSTDCSVTEVSYANSGAYVVELVLNNEYGCESRTLSDTVNLYEADASFIFAPQAPTLDDPVIDLVDNSEVGDASAWSVDGQAFAVGESTQLLPEQLGPGVFQVCLEMSTLDGCIDTVCHDIEVVQNVKVWVPMAFTPDGANPVFIPVIHGEQFIEDYYFTIVDRAGNELFNTDVMSEGWPGRAKSGLGLMQSVYQWELLIQVVDEAEPRLLQGMVSLLK